MKHFLSILLLICSISLIAQNRVVPSVYENIRVFGDDVANVRTAEGEKLIEKRYSTNYSLNQFTNQIKGTASGFDFDFGRSFNGLLYFGFTNAHETSAEQVIYFKRFLEIKEGKCSLNMDWLKGKYDMVNWQTNGYGTLGYRVMSDKGSIIYDGRFSFSHADSSFRRIPGIMEGPFLNQVTPVSAVVSFKTDLPVKAELKVQGRSYKDEGQKLYHEFEIYGLLPDSRVRYEVIVDRLSRVYSFYTNPEPGSRKAFVFAYASDSRAGQGGGERDIQGANAYIMKRIMASNRQKGARFMQFTGDLINGYLTDREAMRLQYANWKRAVEPWWHEMPIYVGFGNHECLGTAFRNDVIAKAVMVDRFPFGTEDAESLFAEEFCNFSNGPVSEDGSSLDPNEGQIDFPRYDETVYSYSYDNVAVVCLNSNYWYAPDGIELVGGNPHAYIMDMQLQWLEMELIRLEQDADIDHVFVTQHTPAFPNGGHVQDDMWYSGNNDIRPYVAGKSAKYGIIERRDQYLDLLVNRSTKVRAILTGDELNYNKLYLTNKTKIYLDNYDKKNLRLSRPLWQINNGSAGAPYYAQEQTPWSPSVSNFSTQNVVVYLHVKGMEVRAEVINPVTFEKVDDFQVYPPQ